MTDDEMIAHHIATKGVIVRPTAIAAYGWTPGLSVPRPASDEAPERFNGPDAKPTRLNHGRDAANASRQRLYDGRRRDIVSEYLKDPSPETIHVIAEKYGVTTTNVGRMMREAGIKNVVTTINRKGSWAWPSTEGRMEAVYDVLNSAAEKGIECPSNPVLSACLNMGDSTVSVNVNRLVKAGKIIVERQSNYRVVTIIATGKQTKRPTKMMG